MYDEKWGGGKGELKEKREKIPEKSFRGKKKMCEIFRTVMRKIINFCQILTWALFFKTQSFTFHSTEFERNLVFFNLDMLDQSHSGFFR